MRKLRHSAAKQPAQDCAALKRKGQTGLPLGPTQTTALEPPTSAPLSPVSPKCSSVFFIPSL